jgi:hypothetical protein
MHQRKRWRAPRAPRAAIQRRAPAAARAAQPAPTRVPPARRAARPARAG